MTSVIFLLSVLLPFCFTLPQGFQKQPLQCSSIQSSGYYCVPSFLCNATGYISTEGGGRDSNVPVPQIENEEELSAHCDTGQVCCCRGNCINKKIGIGERNQKIRSCGTRNENGVGIRVRGGLQKGDSKFGEWPHVCAVLVETELEDGSKVGLYKCAGSLISKEVVLTGAHCIKEAFENNEKIRVRCGEWDTSSQDEMLPYQEKAVSEVITHPNFNKNNLHNDFALLITEVDFELDEHISPVCLPSPSDMFKPLDCVSNGWGKDQFGSEGQYQTRLKTIHLPLVGHQECQSRLQETRLGRFFELDDSFICAGGEKGFDTCKGDGGGPLSCRYDESGPWFQVGIVSWGIGCGEDIPAVYANVAKAACWINKEISCYFSESAGDTFGASNVIPSHFGVRPEDCPGEFAIGNCDN